MDNLIKCEECGKEFKNKLGLAGHKRSHDKEPTEGPAAPVRKIEKVEVINFNTTKYTELPPVIIDHLKIVFGNWLNHFEVGQQWRNDYGGYGMYIKVPEQFSTEWKKVQAPIYDNLTMRLVGQKTEIIQDIRWKPLKDMADVVKWIDQVKHNLIDNAYRKGIRLPSTNTGLDETRLTRDQYESAIAGVKQPI